MQRGPRENLARPAIHPLFRSAACSFGARVIGAVLTGALNDGTAGLAAIKRCGGIAVVQDPADAAVPDMPRSARTHVAVDHCLPLAEMGELLARLAAKPAGETPEIPWTSDWKRQSPLQALAGMTTEDRLGTPSRCGCPECHGTLWEIADGDMLRYRCHVGHAFTADVMLAAQDDGERMLWSLLRSHQERAELVRRMAERERAHKRHNAAARLQERAREYDEDAELVRSIAPRSQAGEPGRPRLMVERTDRRRNKEPDKEQAPPTHGRMVHPIVGIGASAGGIDALQKFFPSVALDAGLAFVVVQHLDPDHKSILTELLARSSRLPVTLIEDDTEV